MNYARPTLLAARGNLQTVWLLSKDWRTYGGAAGIDGVTPREFGSRLDQGIARVRERLLSASFRFQPLRVTFVPKKNGGDRAICIPTVEDRLIQRAVLHYLNTGDKLRVRNQVSFGFHAGEGVERAVKKARNLRRDHPWALKSDIESFFNRIDRELLKQDISKRLGKRSVVPILHRAIDCEVKLETQRDRDRLQLSGIEVGRGLRQGMPLSPILSNVVLREFDTELSKAGHHLVRYADDFAILCNSQAECHQVLALVTNLLAKKNHQVPALGPDSKTVICGPNDPMEFLGFDIVPDKAKYKIVAPARAMERVDELAKPFCRYSTCQEEWKTFPGALQALNARLSSFANSYRIAANARELSVHAVNRKRQTILRLVEDLFGVKVTETLSPDKLGFLDIAGP